MSNFIEKQIIISGVESTTSNGVTRIKIKDQDGLSYSFFQNKQDGSQSQAYTNFITLPNGGNGNNVMISYIEKPNPKSPQYPYKNITGIKPCSLPLPAPQPQNVPQPTNPPQTPPTAPQSQINPNVIPYAQGKVNTNVNNTNSDDVKKNIRWCNALNNACLLVANGKLISPYSDENAKGGEFHKVINIANFIYQLEPSEGIPKPPNTNTATVVGQTATFDKDGNNVPQFSKEQTNGYPEKTNPPAPF